MKNVYCLDLLQQYLTAHFGSCGFCDQSTCDLFHVLHGQFFITCDQFYTTSDQFEKGHGQNWSQNQLVRLFMDWSLVDWSQKTLNLYPFKAFNILY